MGQGRGGGVETWKKKGKEGREGVLKYAVCFISSRCAIVQLGAAISISSSFQKLLPLLPLFLLYLKTKPMKSMSHFLNLLQLTIKCWWNRFLKKNINFLWLPAVNG